MPWLRRMARQGNRLRGWEWNFLAIAAAFFDRGVKLDSRRSLSRGK
jgi:hypothetical protein